MSTYRLIPGAIDYIQRAMAEVHIKPAQQHVTPAAAAQRHERYYMTPVVTAGGSMAWFKASLQDSPWLRRGLREEIRVQRNFALYEKRARPGFDSPSFLAADDHHRTKMWLLRKYWTGTFAGDMLDRYGATRSFLGHVGPRRMAGILGDVRAMTTFMRRRLELDTHGLQWHLLDFHYYREHFLGPLVRHPLNPGIRRDDLDRMEEVLTQHRSFFVRHATTFAHGDFYPNNILIQPGPRHRVVLFDWELSHLNLPTFDPVMVYLQAWRSPAWQDAFRRQTVRLLGDTSVTTTAWRLSTISLATRLAGFCFIRLAGLQPDRYPRLRPAERLVLRALFLRQFRQLMSAYQQRS